MKAQKGFTLIELMVVVTIVAILAAIAVPAYSDYVTVSRLAEARSNLSNGRASMEQWYQDNRTYIGGLAVAGVGGCVAAGGAIAFNGSKYFAYACTAVGQDTFTLTATGVAAQQMGSFAFTINQSNAKATTGVPAGWTSKPNCWVTNKSGAC